MRELQNEEDKVKQKHIVSFSGGKDSTAMLIRMLELGMQIDKIVFADTKFEFPAMYRHIKEVERYIKRPITILRTEDTFDSWFFGTVTRGKMKGQQRGFPLQFFPCWWSRESKFKILDSVCKGHIRYIGIAADEPRRIRNTEGYRYPLNEWGWTEQDCINYLKEKDLFPPILNQFKRTGCWLCPKQSEESLRTLKKEYPALWLRLKEYEKLSPHGFRPNLELKNI